MPDRPSRDAALRRLLALVQLFTSPIMLVVFIVAEPGLVPEWPRYVWLCLQTVIDGRRR